MILTAVRWGYREPRGTLRIVSEREANEGYMDAEECARRLAAARGGQVVRQTVVTTESEWLPA